MKIQRESSKSVYSGTLLRKNFTLNCATWSVKPFFLWMSLLDVFFTATKLITLSASSLVSPKVVAAMKKWWALLTLLACLRSSATSKSMNRTLTSLLYTLMCSSICQLVYTSANSWKKSLKVSEALTIMLNSTRSISHKSWKMRAPKTCNYVCVKSGSTSCTTSVTFTCKRHLALSWWSSSDLKLIIRLFKFLTTVLLLVALLTNFLTTKKEESTCHVSVLFTLTVRTN